MAQVNTVQTLLHLQNNTLVQLGSIRWISAMLPGRAEMKWEERGGINFCHK